jgi:hypothetical protein
MKTPENLCFRVTVLVLGVVALHSAWLYVEARRLEHATAAIRAKGEPATVEDLERARAARPSANEANGCRYLAAAAALVRPFPMRSNPFEHIRGAMTAPSPAEVAWVRKAVADNREAFEMMAQDAACGPCRCEGRVRWPADALFRLTSLRATLRAFDGDGNGAIDDLRSELRLMSLDPFGFGWSWFSVSVFNRDARVVLERARPSEAALRRLEASFRDFGDPHKAVVRMAESWRVWMGSPSTRPSWWGQGVGLAFLDHILEPGRLHYAVTQLRQGTILVDASRRPWPVARDVLDRLNEGHPGNLPDNRTFFVGLLRRATQTRCTVVVVSLARHRDGSGAPPPTLADLPADVDRDDPLTGKPLLYKRDGNRVTVYGVGDNYEDDGGALSGQLGDQDGADWGVSVLLP